MVPINLYNLNRNPEGIENMLLPAGIFVITLSKL